MLTINWACSSQIEHVHHKLSMFTINWACSPQIEHAHHKLSMFTMNYACSPWIMHVHLKLSMFKNLCTPFYTFVHCCTLSPFITPCYLELDIVNAISADVQIWKLSLLLSKFENYLCFCPNLKTISAVVQIWKLSLLLSKFENYLSCCPKLKTIWNFNGELQQCTIVYNSVQ